jgi:hypothetical protein
VKKERPLKFVAGCAKIKRSEANNNNNNNNNTNSGSTSKTVTTMSTAMRQVVVDGENKVFVKKPTISTISIVAIQAPVTAMPTAMQKVVVDGEYKHKLLGAMVAGRALVLVAI